MMTKKKEKTRIRVYKNNCWKPNFIVFYLCYLSHHIFHKLITFILFINIYFMYIFNVHQLFSLF